MVRVQDVEIWILEFGVVNSWGNPEVKIRVINRSDKTAGFDPSLCRIDIEGKLAKPILSRDNDTENGHLQTQNPAPGNPQPQRGEDIRGRCCIYNP